MSAAVTIHKGHISAVTAVDYSPTGLEIVSGSYDRTLRIFGNNQMSSRDVYHTKRMQRVMSVMWSSDNRYILNASDEMNIRIWKARASEKLGVLVPREKNSLRYSESLKSKYEMFPEIRRIAKHRQVPKYIFNASKEHRKIHMKEIRKEANRRNHSKPGSVPHLSARRKPVISQE